MFINPEKKFINEQTKALVTGGMKTYFQDPNVQAVYPALFKLLWHSSLPCSQSSHAMLRQCEWAGQTVDCSQLFQTIPTDQGMCCAFNYVNTLRNSAYSTLLNKMKTNSEESQEGIKSVKKATVGKHNGLRVVLDQHSNLKSVGTLSKDYSALQFFVGGKNEFPQIRERGFLLEPGHEHYLEISGISIKANQDIKKMSASQRNCHFSDEGSLSYHSKYTYSSCKFEADLARAMRKHNCTPWFLPTHPEKEGEVCDPWRGRDFTREMEDGEAEHCLQDCQGTKYSTQRSSAPFRLNIS